MAYHMYLEYFQHRINLSDQNSLPLFLPTFPLIRKGAFLNRDLKAPRLRIGEVGFRRNLGVVDSVFIFVEQSDFDLISSTALTFPTKFPQAPICPPFL
jgi:hypothetical protein